MGQCKRLFCFTGESGSCQGSMEDAPCRDEMLHGCATSKIAAGVANDQGDMHQFVIKREGMAYQALLAEVLAVIGADDQQGVVEPATCEQLVQEGAYKLV